MKKLPSIFFFLPLTVLLAYCITISFGAPFSDYAAYYFGSKELLNGNFNKVYDTYQLNLQIQGQGFKGIFASYTPFTPFTSIVFSPFLSLPIKSSKLLFNLFSAGFFLIAIYRSFKVFNIPKYVLLLIPLIFFIPIKNNILFGQAYLILIGLILEGFIALEKKRIVLTSLFWGFAIVFKIFPVLLVVYLLFKKEFRAALGVCLASFAILLLSVMINGYEVWLFYIKLLPRLNNGELNDSFTFMFQSFFMLLKKLFVFDKLQNPQPIFNNSYIFVVLLAIYKSIVLSLSVSVSLQKKKNDLLTLSFWILASILLSPNGSSYSLVLLIIPLLCIVKWNIRAEQKLVLFGFLFVISNLSVHYFSSLPVLIQFPRLYLLLVLFLVLYFLSERGFKIRYFGIALIFFLVLDIPRLFQQTDKSEYLFLKDEHILTTGIYISQGKLAYTYWSEFGEQAIITDLFVYNYQPAELKGNQVFYKDQQLTDSKDWKRNPIAINNNYIVYLSDKNRGVGFFTIRKIKIN